MVKICFKCFSKYMLENRSLFIEEIIDFSFFVVKVVFSDGVVVIRQSRGEWFFFGWWVGSFIGIVKCIFYLLCKGIGIVRYLLYYFYFLCK